MTQWIAGIAAALAVAAPSAQDKPKLAGNRADEPVAQEFSLRKAVDFMDSAARMWNTKYK